MLLREPLWLDCSDSKALYPAPGVNVSVFFVSTAMAPMSSSSG